MVELIDRKVNDPSSMLGQSILISKIGNIIIELRIKKTTYYIFCFLIGSGIGFWIVDIVKLVSKIF